MSTPYGYDPGYMPPQLVEGRTVPLSDYQVDHEPAGTDYDGDDYPECWVVYHYVGGEDYTDYWCDYPTAVQAYAEQHRLNNTLPPRGYTHAYWRG